MISPTPKVENDDEMLFTRVVTTGALEAVLPRRETGVNRMGEYYDRQGNPIRLEQWANAIETRQNDRRVAETTLPNGRWVSTVWLGIDHSFGSGPPLIFETMVFKNREDMGDLDCDRYSTEAEALAGHEAMCRKWAVEEPEPVDG